ncbi:hypothetical protein [Xanthomonas cerealis]|uniref:hypothetical protein n=1 Tax=Xanthomonas cerealis TaxID=3390025 RepID=UPI00163CF5AB|nr:hypothetical protein [Xanthomonas translucens]
MTQKISGMPWRCVMVTFPIATNPVIRMFLLRHLCTAASMVLLATTYGSMLLVILT